MAGKTKRKDGFQLAGEKAAVFGLIYDAWYANLSMIAHQRLPGIEKSVAPDELSSPERTRMASDILTSACFFSVCVLTEIQSLGGIPAPAKLREAWVYVRDRSPEMKAAYDMRYERLLQGSREPAEQGVEADEA